MISFQDIADQISEDIGQLIKTCYDCSDCEVTVMQRFYCSEKGKDYVTMISCFNHNGDRSPHFGQKFYLDEPLRSQSIHENGPEPPARLPFFTVIFNNSHGRLAVLESQAAVREKFVHLVGSVNRENRICQYIGLPIRSGFEVVALIQIDVSIPGLFGKDEHTIEQVAQEIFSPYSRLLHAYYEYERLSELLIDKR